MSEEGHSAARQPRQQWGILSGTLFAFAAFLLPQFGLYPILGLVVALPIDDNAKQFLLQGIAELGAVGLLWLLVHYHYRTDFKALGLGKLDPGLLGWSVLALPFYMASSIIVTVVAAALSPSIDLQQVQNIGYANPGGFVIVLVFVALVLLAPFVEELIFRGFLFNAFRRTFGFWIGAIVVSLLFAVAHRQLNVGLDVFVLSMFLCYLREKTASLWPSIALHALKNLVAFVTLFIIHAR